ncbi:polysaccharide biosynthesis/export family protein [Pacificimonas flava]|nr:polysaccharide biosynthesis/export family protein [Pacificimonas flava]MBB5279794.1 polysaccharide export outer membrane protein [Pacificimonas flava]
MSRTTDEYRLGLGDKLRVSVFNEENLSGEFQVSGAGTINMPLVGDVEAVGLTAAELKTRLTERYSDGFVIDPQIIVEVYDFRPYFVLGEVAKPGRYPAEEGMTLLGAVATAGGFTYRADKDTLFIRRAGSNREYSVNAARNINILPGDIVRVGERYF